MSAAWFDILNWSHRSSVNFENRTEGKSTRTQLDGAQEGFNKVRSPKRGDVRAEQSISRVVRKKNEKDLWPRVSPIKAGESFADTRTYTLKE